MFFSLCSRFAATAEGEDEELPPAASEPPSGHIQEMLASTMKQIEERKRQTEVMLVSGGRGEGGGGGERRRVGEEGVPYSMFCHYATAILQLYCMTSYYIILCATRTGEL